MGVSMNLLNGDVLITTNECTINNGIELAVDVQKAYKNENDRLIDGVLQDGEFKRTLPLNTRRVRTLATDVLNKPHFNFMDNSLGLQYVIEASELQKLPDFDKYNQAYVDSFHNRVGIRIVMREPSYGLHITVTQLVGTN